MKNIKLYIASLLSVVVFTACDSLLEENPKYSQNSKVVFSTESNAELALLGCYGYLSSGNAYGQIWQEMPIAFSGLTWGQQNGADIGQLASLNVSPSNDIVSKAWNGMYKVISESNAFLASMDASGLNDTVKIQKNGEAKFLRALAYYNLVTSFGAVPLKVVASTSDGIASERTPEVDIYNQIVSDLNDAAKISETAKMGRATSWTVKAYLAKVHHRMAMANINRTENLQKAKAYCDEVYNSGVYKLEANPSKLFRGWVNTSPEIIFQLNLASSTSYNYNRGSNRFSPQASTSGVNWGTYRVQKYAYDLQRSVYPDDPRIEMNYLTSWRSRTGNNQASPKPQVGTNLCANDSTYTYPYTVYTSSDIVPGSKNVKKIVPVSIPYSELSTPANPDLLQLASYNNPTKVQQYNKAIQDMPVNFTKAGNVNKWPFYSKMYDQEQKAQAAQMNLIVYRYSEFLLLMADVYNELGDTQRAISLANEVLTRARNMSNATYPQNWSTTLTKEEVTEKLYFERIFELSGEPSLLEVTRCHGEVYLKKLLTLNVNHQLQIKGFEAYKSTANAFTDILFNDGVITDNFVKRNMLLPIPQSEIDANSALDSEDQNEGY